MVTGKIPGRLRAVVCHDIYCAEMTSKSNTSDDMLVCKMPFTIEGEQVLVPGLLVIRQSTKARG